MSPSRLAGLLLCALFIAAPPRAVSGQTLARIDSPGTLAIEMVKALVSADRERFTSLIATREEMERMLEVAQPPMTAVDRQDLRDRVAEILTDRADDFDRFQTMKKSANVPDDVAMRFEIVALDSIYEKDGMKKVRHSRLRMIQTGPDGRDQRFLITLDDMFLFPRGWAFTSVIPGIGREP